MKRKGAIGKAKGAETPLAMSLSLKRYKSNGNLNLQNSLFIQEKGTEVLALEYRGTQIKLV